jgi:hypothetical protein
MTYLYLKLTFPLLLVFTAAILLIHLQPYDDSDLRAFLTPPDGCPAPCFTKAERSNVEMLTFHRPFHIRRY